MAVGNGQEQSIRLGLGQLPRLAWLLLTGLLWPAQLPVLAGMSGVAEAGLERSARQLAEAFPDLARQAIEEPEAALEKVELALRGVERLPPGHQIQLLRLRAYLAWRLEDLLGATQGYHDLWRRSVEVGDIDGQGWGINGMAGVLWLLRDYDGALTLLLSAIAILDSEDHAHLYTSTLGNLGLLYADMGKTNESLEILQEVLSLQTRAVSPSNEGAVQRNLGQLALRQGNLHRAVDHFSAALRSSNELGRLEWAASDHVLLARTYLQQGDLQGAGSHARRALELARSHCNPRAQRDALELLASVQGAVDEFANAYELQREYTDQITAFQRQTTKRELITLLDSVRRQLETGEALRPQAAAPQSRWYRQGRYQLALALAVLLILSVGFLQCARHRFNVLPWRRRSSSTADAAATAEPHGTSPATSPLDDHPHYRPSAAADRYLATLRHDIRSILNGVTGMAELLAEMKLPATQRGYVVTLRAGSDALLEKLNEWEDFIAMEMGTWQSQTAVFDLVELLEDCLNPNRPVFQRTRLQLQLSYDPRLPRLVCGDAQALGKVLLRLLISISRSVEQGTVHLQVDALELAMDKLRLRFTLRLENVGAGDAASSSPQNSWVRRVRSESLFQLNRVLQAIGGTPLQRLPQDGQGFSFDLPLDSANQPEAIGNCDRLFLVEVSELIRPMLIAAATSCDLPAVVLSTFEDCPRAVRHASGNVVLACPYDVFSRLDAADLARLHDCVSPNRLCWLILCRHEEAAALRDSAPEATCIPVTLPVRRSTLVAQLRSLRQ